ncbi:MAG: SCO family protein [Proteobacteria bacterium]|nr:SCO family protein [Pseudomonadota bacterium]
MRLTSLVLTIGLLISAPTWAHSLEELERDLSGRERFVEIVNRPAPHFALEDAEGSLTDIGDLESKVVVLYFIYAFCPNVCPLQSSRVAEVQEIVNSTPLRDLVTFVAISTDPVRDTPPVLRAYAGSHGLDPVNFVFLTSGAKRPDLTREIADEYGLKFTPTDDGNFTHAVVTHVIDKEGMLRARYHGLNFDAANMALQIDALANDFDTHPIPVDGFPVVASNGRTGAWAAAAMTTMILLGLAAAAVHFLRRRSGPSSGPTAFHKQR